MQDQQPREFNFEVQHFARFAHRGYLQSVHPPMRRKSHFYKTSGFVSQRRCLAESKIRSAALTSSICLPSIALPLSASRRIRILSSVVYRLPFILSGSLLAPRLTHHPARKIKVTSMRTLHEIHADMKSLVIAYSISALFWIAAWFPFSFGYYEGKSGEEFHKRTRPGAGWG